MNTKISRKIEQASVILTPKGENRTRVVDMLRSNDIVVPEFAGRCLHGRCGQQAVCFMER